MIFAFARVWGERSSFPDDILDHPETACGQPAIHGQGGTIDKPGFIRTEEGHCGRDVLRLPHPALRVPAFYQLKYFWTRLHTVTPNRRFHRPRKHGIAADSFGSVSDC